MIGVDKMANHEKVYGICENKCQEEVYRKNDADNQFLSKSDARATYAVKNHATSSTMYGVATSRVYGHVKLENNLTIPEQASSGIALQASAGKALNDRLTTAENNIRNLSPKIPVGGIFTATYDIANPIIVSSLLGYGTWQLFYTLTIGTAAENIYFFKRTA